MAQFDYLISVRNIVGKTFGEEPGGVHYLKMPRTSRIPTPEHEHKDAKQWFTEVRDAADGMADGTVAEAGDVLIFVHGYNNDLDVIMKRQRRLQADLSAEGWRGLVVAFDWPSANSTLNYIEDRQDASEVAHLMVTHGVLPLARGQAGKTADGKPCQTNIHLIGHSTGAYVIMDAFTNAEKVGELHKSDWRIAQVAFIAGDVSVQSLGKDTDWARPMYRRIMRLTNYSSPYDSVLGVSNAKRLGVAPRTGRSGLPPDADHKAINVDCGEYFTKLDPRKETFYGTFNHSWHIGNRVFSRDLAMALEGQIDRWAIPTRGRDGDRLVLRDAPRPKHQKDWQLTKGKV